MAFDLSTARPVDDQESTGKFDVSTARPVRSNLFTDPRETLQRSAGEFVGGIKEAVTHPVQTAKSLTSLAKGIVQKAIPGEQADEKTANALGTFFKSRYGSLDAVKQTALEDPVGFASDLSIFLTGGGGAVTKVGQVAKAGKLAKAGQVATKVGRAVDPLAAVTKTAGTALKTATKGRRFAAVPRKSIDQPVVQAAARRGVELPASAKTTSRAVPIVEATAGKGFFGTSVSKRVATAQEKLVDIADDLIKKTSSSDDLGSAGIAISEGAENLRQRFFNIKEMLYNKADFTTKGKNIKLVPNRSLAFIDEILADKVAAKELLGQASDMNYFKNLGSRLRLKKGVNATTAKAAIKELNNKIRNINDPVATGNKGVLKKLTTLLADDLDEAVIAADPRLGQQISRANKFYRLSLKELNSKFGEKIVKLKDQPDKILPAIINKQTSSSDIKRIYRLIGQENVPQVQAAFLKQLFSGAQKNGNFTPTGISRQIKSFGRDKLQRILTKEQMATLDDLDLISRSLGKAGKIAEGSQTAFIGRIAAEFGLIFNDPLTAAQLLLSDATFSRFVGSPTGQKLLAEGVIGTGRTGQRLIDASRPVGAAGRGLRVGNLLDQQESLEPATR